MESLGNSGSNVVSDVNSLMAISCAVKTTDQHLRQNSFYCKQIFTNLDKLHWFDEIIKAALSNTLNT